MTHLNVEKGQCHQAGVAGRKEKRQEGNIRQSTRVHKYEEECVSKHFMFTLKCMLFLNRWSAMQQTGFTRNPKYHILLDFPLTK